MAKAFKTNGKPFRLCCPECRTSWDTMTAPDYCPKEDCGAMVTFRTVKWTAREIRKAEGEAKALAKALHFD